MLLAKKCFLTKGVGVDKHKLTSFELALRDAKIASYNIVRVSSIFPPHCKMVPVETGVRYLTPGQVLYVVLAENASNEPNRLIAASVGVAIPRRAEQYGYLSEHHPFGETEQKAGEYAEDLAASMLATILGVRFDPNSSYDEKKEQWKISDKIVSVFNANRKTNEATHNAKLFTNFFLNRGVRHHGRVFDEGFYSP